MIEDYKFSWPNFDLSKDTNWKYDNKKKEFVRQMPESEKNLALDSRWPAFFPAPICYITVSDGIITGLEREVGATIVNRFPFVIAVSICVQPLSERHYARNQFIEILEKGERAAIQFFGPGEPIDKLNLAIKSYTDQQTTERINATGLSTRAALLSNCPVFSDAYMVYETRLVKPGKDFSGNPIYEKPYTEYGTHRVYYFEIEAIQLRHDIASGDCQIYWRSLPNWENKFPLQNDVIPSGQPISDIKYKKSFSPHYYFPSENTVAFEYNKVMDGMAVKYLPPLPEDQVEVDDDRARWPSFFPSSAGIITTWGEENIPNLMPCGSTSVLIRNPFCIGICVAYAEINIRYAPRGSLKALEKNGRFGCGVPFINPLITDAIKYAGNVSISNDKNKVENSGLEVWNDNWAPVLPALPLHFDCEIKKVIRLGTHFLFLAEVKTIRVREDVSQMNQINWYPFPEIIKRINSDLNN